MFDKKQQKRPGALARPNQNKHKRKCFVWILLLLSFSLHSVRGDRGDLDPSALRTSRARNEIKFLTFGLGWTFPSESEAERTLPSELDEQILQALNNKICQTQDGH